MPSVAAELGLSPRALVVTAAMDQIGSTLGAGNVADGIITETTGTVLVIAATCGKESLCADKHVTVYKHALPGKYLYLPICMTGGMALKWFKDHLARLSSLWRRSAACRSTACSTSRGAEPAPLERRFDAALFQRNFTTAV